MRQAARSSVEEELKRQLVFIEDPVKRLQEMLKHGLKQEAKVLLVSIINETKPIYFQMPDRSQDIARLGEKFESKFIVVIGERLSFDPQSLQKLMGWKKKEMSDFMRMVFKATLKLNPLDLRHEIANWAGPHETLAMEEAMDMFLTDDDPLTIEVKRWMLREHFSDRHYITCYWHEKYQEKWFGKSFPAHSSSWHKCSPFCEEGYRRDCALVDAVIKKMGELGMSRDEIREDFFSWLETYVANLNPDLLIARANSLIFRYKEDDERRASIMAKEIDVAMEWLMEGRPLFHPVTFSYLIEGRMLDSAEGRAKAQKLYRQHASKLLAEGRFGLLFEITVMLGHKFFDKDEFSISQCAAKAFDIAWHKSEYGKAAALVNHFGEEDCLDPKVLEDKAKSLAESEKDGDTEVKLAELVKERKTQIQMVVSLAKTTNQPIQINYSSVFIPKL